MSFGEHCEMVRRRQRLPCHSNVWMSKMPAASRATWPAATQLTYNSLLICPRPFSVPQPGLPHGTQSGRVWHACSLADEQWYNEALIDDALKDYHHPFRHILYYFSCSSIIICTYWTLVPVFSKNYPVGPWLVECNNSTSIHQRW